MKISTRILSATLFTVLAVTSSVSVYAASSPVHLNIQAQSIKLSETYQLVINGTPLAQKGHPVYINERGFTMVPLRALAEKLGYQVTWNPHTRSVELTQGPQWAAVTVGKDQYSFAKMVRTLGTAPEARKGAVYVPLAFAEEILQAVVTMDQEGNIQIDDLLHAPTKKGTISKITLKSEGDSVKGSILVNGYANGMVLSIHSNTVIVNQDNKPLSINDLRLAASIEFIHDSIMTMSQPPMTGAKKIIVHDKDSAQTTVLGTGGEVLEVSTSTDGTTRIVIKGEKLTDQSFEEIGLMIGKETLILDAKDQRALTVEALKKGTKVYGFYGPTTTKSLPPIGQAIKLVVEQADSGVVPK